MHSFLQAHMILGQFLLLKKDEKKFIHWLSRGSYVRTRMRLFATNV